MTSKPTLKIYHQRNIRVDENCQEIAVCCIHWERKVELKVMLLHTGPKLTAYMWTMTVSARWKSNSIQVKKNILQFTLSFHSPIPLDRLAVYHCVIGNYGIGTIRCRNVISLFHKKRFQGTKNRFHWSTLHK